MKGKMFALDELSDGSDSEPDSGSQDAQPAVLKKKAKAVTVEELLAAGYKAPDVKRIREPRPEEPSTWDWSNGRSAKQQEVQETAEELAATRHAATLGAEETARHAQAALAFAERQRQERRLEKEKEKEAAAEKKLSISQKASSRQQMGRRKTTQGDGKRGCA
ncbi:hypothetical protein QJQ45_006607 [Haematococcus lacustris]|nr:hypothetical protein QJQ45_006607 [Haematococcus lacustris]